MITIGADPELFLKQADRYLSAYGLIPGDKVNPHAVEFGAVQVDGMAVEFNIHPADSREVFVHNIKAVMAQLREMLPDYDVVPDSVATFDDDYLKQQPDAALDLGCDPDYNGWTMQENKKPDYRLSFRTGAGHVHVGIGHFKFDDKHLHMCSSLVKQLDFYLGRL